MGNGSPVKIQTPTGVKFRRARLGDLDAIRSNLSKRKESDFRKFFPSVTAGLKALMQSSRETYAITLHNHPVALFGISETAGDVGVMWSAMTKTAERHPRTCIKAARAILDHFNTLYPVLASSIPADDSVQERWVKLLGCSTEGEREGRILFQRTVA